MPLLKKEVLKYSDYASKTYETLLPEPVRQGALDKEMKYLKRAILWNEEGGFRLEALPQEAQYAPVFSIVVDDLDGDNQLDIWLGGNFYGLKPEVGRLDASEGTFLKGDGKGKFEVVPASQTGIRVKGEVRDATTIETTQGKVLIVARNNQELKAFKLK